MNTDSKIPKKVADAIDVVIAHVVKTKQPVFYHPSLKKGEGHAYMQTKYGIGGYVEDNSFGVATYQFQLGEKVRNRSDSRKNPQTAVVVGQGFMEQGTYRGNVYLVSSGIGSNPLMVTEGELESTPHGI
jgi:hypothetical protein